MFERPVTTVIERLATKGWGALRGAGSIRNGYRSSDLARAVKVTVR